MEIARSTFIVWNDDNIAKAPAVCGVYILRDVAKGIGYIGMAGASRLCARLKEHKTNCDHPLTRYFDWYQHDTEASAKATEAAWIEKHKPPWNKK